MRFPEGAGGAPGGAPEDAAAIVVFGGGGLVGRQIAEALAAAGVSVAVAGRRAEALASAASAAGVPAVRVRVADAGDAAALGRAFAGARVVVNAAGPLRDTAAPVLAAALAAGAHYVDVGGEQAVLHALHERHESAARRAGLVALPGAGLDCLIGDLAAAWAAAHLVAESGGDGGDSGDGAAARDGEGGGSASGDDGGDGGGGAVRGAPAPRLAEDRPLDEIAVTYVLDDLVISPTAQRAWLGAAFERALVWRRDRWEPARAGAGRRVNAGPALGGERAAVAHAGGDAITVPRHVAAGVVATYVSPTRRAGASTALRLVSRALPFLPRAAADLLVPYADPAADYGRTRFAVVAQARRGFEAVQIVVRGADVHRTTARAAAWAARRLAARGAGPVGMRAPGELFRGEPALRELAAEAGLTIEPSFGCGIKSP
jgi:Saccharopine dehydrogenase NADP binding domain